MLKKLTPLCLFLTTMPLQTLPLNITSIHDLLKTHPEIEYIKCQDAQPFEYEQFPISAFPELQPNKGIFAESFVVKIPNGQVNSYRGWIKIGNDIMQEAIPHIYSMSEHKNSLARYSFENVKKVTGKVVVITIFLDACYGHWIYNVLGRLALIEAAGIEYDWLYVSNDLPFMKETLELWGINPAKIITPFGENKYIQADELIVPSHIGVRTPLPHEYFIDHVPLPQLCTRWNMNPKALSLPGNFINQNTDKIPTTIPIDNYFLNWTPLCNYVPIWVTDYLKNKFLPHLKNTNYNFSKKVFISRKDTSRRVMINEDEIFALFEKQGFTRYVPGNMSIIEQIALFNGAEIIVAAIGSSLSNLVFCKPHTTVIEIFQNFSDSMFYYLSLNLQLNHHCIKTMEFTDIMGPSNTIVNEAIIQDFIENNQSLFTKEEHV